MTRDIIIELVKFVQHIDDFLFRVIFSEKEIVYYRVYKDGIETIKQCSIGDIEIDLNKNMIHFCDTSYSYYLDSYGLDWSFSLDDFF